MAGMSDSVSLHDKIVCRVVADYRLPYFKSLARQIKAGQQDGILAAARHMVPLVPPGAVLVPIPSHTGEAVQTLMLAQALASLTGAQVSDLLAGTARESSFALKHRGIVLQTEDMGFRLKAPPMPGTAYFLVDNVVASGNTVRAAVDLLPGAGVLALASDTAAVGRRSDIVVGQCLHTGSSLDNSYSFNDSASMMHKQGVILVTSQGTTLAADFYRSLAQKDKIWRSWVDVAAARGLKDSTDFTVSDYPLKISSLIGLTDRQVGFALQGEKPERTVTALQAVFARCSGVDAYDADAVSALIRDSRDSYLSFLSQADALTARLNTCREAEEAEIPEYSRIRRLFALKGHLSFVGAERITGAADIAALFSFLQDKSVENAFVVLSRGQDSAVIHLGIGGTTGVCVDALDILTAADRFDADKVWFVHNHPSGSIVASRLDTELHTQLSGLLGSRLQPSVIINTNTGRYGVFDDKTCVPYGRPGLGTSAMGTAEIPVYSFDRTCFLNQGQRRYTFQHDLDVATFLSTQRLGRRYKYSLIAINNSGALNGYFHLPYADLRQVPARELAGYVAQCCVHCMGRGAFLVGYDGGELLRMAPQLVDELNRLSGGRIHLYDVFHINERKVMRSMNDSLQTITEDGLAMAGAGEPAVVSGPDVSDRVTGAVVIGRDRPMVRCSIDGVPQCARPLDRADVALMGALSADADAMKSFALSMALKHFSTELLEGVQTLRSRGVGG